MRCLYMKLPRRFSWKMVRCYPSAREQALSFALNSLELKASNSPFVNWSLSNEETDRLLKVLILSGCSAEHAIVERHRVRHDISCDESTITLVHKLAEKPGEQGEVSSLLDLCLDRVRRILHYSCSHQMLINAGLPPKLCSAIRRDALIEDVMSIIKSIKQNKTQAKENEKRRVRRISCLGQD